MKTDVLVRDGAELNQIISAKPFGDAVRDHASHLLVILHREPFPPVALELLRTARGGPEQLCAMGRE